MKKILIVGNSHVGALKQGYDKLVSTYPHHVDFYSIPGGGGPSLSVENNAIVNTPTSAQTNLAINDGILQLDHYDALLLSGVGAHAIRNITTHPLHKNKVAKFKPNENLGYSESMMRAVVANFVKAMPSIKNIKKIASNFTGQIYIQMFPLPTRFLIEQEDFSQYYSDKETFNMLSWYYGIQLDVILNETKPFNNISVLEYESGWMTNGYTPDEFVTKDAWHMNHFFGDYVLQKLAKELL